jgi:hypothetical protein
MEYRIFHVYPTNIQRIVKKPEPTTAKKPLANTRAAKKAPSLVSPRDSRPAAAASPIAPSVPRLNVEDVQGVFESVRNKNRPPPPHLPFQVIPAEPNVVHISPPQFAFDGAYDCKRPTVLFVSFFHDLTQHIGSLILALPRWTIPTHDAAKEEEKDRVQQTAQCPLASHRQRA